MNTIPLYEDTLCLTLTSAYLLTYVWSHGLFLDGSESMYGPVYYTWLSNPGGTYTLTNKYDPRVVRWLEENNAIN
jgi:hypothetical protein